MKKVICPICGSGRLFDANSKTIDIIPVFNKSKKVDIRIKCPRCGKEAALKIVLKNEYG